MANIITNCCLGAFVTRNILKTQFNNPFVWAWVNETDICYLLDKYDTVDFTKFKLQKHTTTPLQDGDCFKICVDGKITIVYSHYQFNSKYSTLCTDNVTSMVYYNKIWEYVVQKYIQRVSRIPPEPPVFILCDDRRDCGYDAEHIKKIAQSTKYKVLLFSSKELESNNPNVFFIKHDGNDLHGILANYSNEIYNFLASSNSSGEAL